MTAASTERTDRRRTGVLVIRVWTEPEHPTELRARIVPSVPVSANGGFGGEDRGGATAAATVEDALRAVRLWLESFTAP